MKNLIDYQILYNKFKEEQKAIPPLQIDSVKTKYDSNGIPQSTSPIEKQNRPCSGAKRKLAEFVNEIDTKNWKLKEGVKKIKPGGNQT